MQSWAFQTSHMPHLTPTVLTGKLTKRDNDGTRDAIGHDDSEHTQHPGIHCSKFIFKCLLLGIKTKHPKLSSHPSMCQELRIDSLKQQFTFSFAPSERSVIFLRGRNDVIRWSILYFYYLDIQKRYCFFPSLKVISQGICIYKNQLLKITRQKIIVPDSKHSPHCGSCIHA